MIRWFIQLVQSYGPIRSSVAFWKDEITPSGEVDWERSKFEPDYRSATLFEDKEEADKRRKEINIEVFRNNYTGDLMVCSFDAAWTPYQLFPESASLFDRLQLPRKLPGAPKT